MILTILGAGLIGLGVSIVGANEKNKKNKTKNGAGESALKTTVKKLEKEVTIAEEAVKNLKCVRDRRHKMYKESERVYNEAKKELNNAETALQELKNQINKQ